jgi:predicted NBD/HSP70 family sugar kinase
MTFKNTPTLLALPDDSHFAEAPERDRARVLAAIATGTQSRPALVERLGLRSTTASRAVAGLVARGLVAEASGEKLGRGRPAGTLALKPGRLGISVLHVASRAFLGVLFDSGGQVLERHMLPVPPEAGNAAIEAALAGLAARLAGAAPPGMAHAGTVVSLSGLVDGARGRWLLSSRWPRLRDADIAAAIAPVAGPVHVVRQLDAEFRARALADPAGYAGEVVVLHWGWGIGMAYGRNGVPFSAAGGSFGEIGHWRIDGLEERRCDCGQQGCLETAAALWALLPVLRKRWPGLPDDEEALQDHLHELDLVSVPEVEQAARHVARALSNLCRILFPTRVVLSSPPLGNAALWARLEALFRAEGPMRGLALPQLANEPMPATRGMAGAAGPLLREGLEALLRGPG